MVAKNGAAIQLMISFFQNLRQTDAEEDIVSQSQGRRCAIQKIVGKQICLRKAIRRGLNNVGQRDAPLTTIPQGSLELILILGRCNHGDFANSDQHQYRNRVINHRFVIKR